MYVALEILFIFMPFPVFIRFNNFLRLCSCSWLFEDLCIFMTFLDCVLVRDFLRFS